LKWLNSAGQQQVREWRMPVMIYREIWKSDVRYETGDTVTWAGSLWVAKADTSEKPGSDSEAWRLAAKHGRDGRDGEPGKKGEKGDPGRPGRDLTLMTGGG
jgi:integrin beta 3